MPSTAACEHQTRSLHDALPIWRPGPRRVAPAGRRSSRGTASSCPPRWARPDRYSPPPPPRRRADRARPVPRGRRRSARAPEGSVRSEEHTSELQSRENLVCRLRRPVSTRRVPSTTRFRSGDLDRAGSHRQDAAQAEEQRRLARPVGPDQTDTLPRLHREGELIERDRSPGVGVGQLAHLKDRLDRKSTRLNSSHVKISYAVYGGL